MGDSTISWTQKTWNPIRAFNKETGKRGWFCTKVTAACDSCYAETMNMKPGASGGTGLAYKPGHLKDVRVELVEAALLEPLGWRTGQLIFPLSMSDLFGDWVPDEMIDRIFAVMSLTPQHTYQVLTKRPKRMREYLSARPQPIWDRHALAMRPKALDQLKALPWPLPNVWVGTSICDQKNAEDFVPELLATPAALHFVSAAPLLGRINLRNMRMTMAQADLMRRFAGHDHYDALHPHWTMGPRIGWVLTEGESGALARPTHPDHFRQLRDDCAATGVPFHHKQNGEWVSVSEVEGKGAHHYFPDGATVRRVGLAKAGRTLDGKTHDAFPVLA